VAVAVPVTPAALAASRGAGRLTVTMLAAGLVSWLAAAVLVRAELCRLGVGVMALSTPNFLARPPELPR
jgi:tetrahydromethanopterin S-methyltransferase subunit D